MSSHQDNDYKALYKSMKRKLKILIYENECFQEELKKAQRFLLRVQRDKSFLLDRIMQYQQGPDSSSDSEETDESDNENYSKDVKRRKIPVEQPSSFALNVQGSSKGNPVKKKKLCLGSSLSAGVVSKSTHSSCHGGKNAHNNAASGNTSKGSSLHRLKGGLLQGNHSSQNSGLSLSNSIVNVTSSNASDGQMTREEIERQLAARQPISDFSTTVSLTLPNQLFSEGDLIDNDLETSPSNIGEDMNFESFD